MLAAIVHPVGLQYICKMPFFDFNSYQLYYSDSGLRTGRVTTFLHGWTCSSKVYKSQLEHFGRKYRVVALDFLGHGQSDRPHPSIAGDLYSHRGFQDSVLALLTHLSINHTTLVAWSIACPAAFEVARRYPEKVDNLILIGCTPIFFLPTDDETFPAIPKSVGEKNLEIVRTSFPVIYYDLVFGWFPEYTPGGPLPEYVEGVLDDTASVGGAIASGINRLTGPEDFRNRIPEITTRTLLVHGGKDSSTLLAAAQWTYEHLAGEKKIVIYEDQGHAPFLGINTQKFNHDVDGFLQSSIEIYSQESRI
jgi:pimeloyl-ACP methyl ester carboxylesterase